MKSQRFEECLPSQTNCFLLDCRWDGPACSRSSWPSNVLKLFHVLTGWATFQVLTSNSQLKGKSWPLWVDRPPPLHLLFPSKCYSFRVFNHSVPVENWGFCSNKGCENSNIPTSRTCFMCCFKDFSDHHWKLLLLVCHISFLTPTIIEKLEHVYTCLTAIWIGGRKLILGRSASFASCDYSPLLSRYLLEFTPFKWSEKLMSVAQLGRNLRIFGLLRL